MLSEEDKKVIETMKSYKLYDYEELDHGVLEYIQENIDKLLVIIENQLKEIEQKTTILFAGAEKVKQLEKEIKEYKNQLDIKNNKIKKHLNEWQNHILTREDDFIIAILKDLL